MASGKVSPRVMMAVAVLSPPTLVLSALATLRDMS